MFYEPDKRNHGLKYNPFKALVVPRPIGWISSLDPEGRPNLAPYSQFNIACDRAALRHVRFEPARRRHRQGQPLLCRSDRRLRGESGDL